MGENIMIIDSISNIDKFLNNNLLFLRKYIFSLSTSTENGVFEIENGCIMKIMSYPLKNKEECVFESHDVFVDLQIILSGIERIDVADAYNLQLIKNDLENDTSFYNSSYGDFISITLPKNYFILLFPGEAHMPQIQNLEFDEKIVKKAVFKIRKDLFDEKYWSK